MDGVVKGNHAYFRVVGKLGHQAAEDGGCVCEEARPHGEGRRLDDEEEGRAPRRPVHVVLVDGELAGALEQLRAVTQVSPHAIRAEVAEVVARHVRPRPTEVAHHGAAPVDECEEGVHVGPAAGAPRRARLPKVHHRRGRLPGPEGREGLHHDSHWHLGVLEVVMGVHESIHGEAHVPRARVAVVRDGEGGLCGRGHAADELARVDNFNVGVAVHALRERSRPRDLRRIDGAVGRLGLRGPGSGLHGVGGQGGGPAAGRGARARLGVWQGRSHHRAGVRVCCHLLRGILAALDLALGAHRGVERGRRALLALLLRLRLRQLLLLRLLRRELLLLLLVLRLLLLLLLLLLLGWHDGQLLVGAAPRVDGARSAPRPASRAARTRAARTRAGDHSARARWGAKVASGPGRGRAARRRWSPARGWRRAAAHAVAHGRSHARLRHARRRSPACHRGPSGLGGGTAV
mmetsp:Transcript_19096/g.56215  ORF Transcript_19096/g.56215 Transcript_19096/m.56215 type:complete len:461 (-) Transcript_19096:270-1652(-)